MGTARTCSMDYCENPYEALGSCKKHYARLRRTGDPSIVRPPGVRSNPDLPPEFRRCARCKKVMPLRFFHKAAHQPKGHDYTCKVCRRATNARYRIAVKKGRNTRPLPPLQPPSDLDWAWIAGFLEGEGSFVYHDRRVIVSATQVEWDPIARLVRLLGGAVYGQRRKPPHNCAVRWQVENARAFEVMRAIYSWMSARRRQQIDHCLLSEE